MEKIKLFIESDKGKDILIIIIIILVGLGSFELGRLSKNTANTGIKVESDQEEPNLIDNESLENNNTNSNLQNLNNFFASNKGSKYYSLSCSAGKTIKQENRIYFKTAMEAEQAGFTASGSCR